MGSNAPPVESFIVFYINILFLSQAVPFFLVELDKNKISQRRTSSTLATLSVKCTAVKLLLDVLYFSACFPHCWRSS